MESHTSFSFIAESTLGKLCKWLRMAGFDAVFDHRSPDPARLAAMAAREDRTVLTRTARVYQAVGTDCAVFIHADQPLDQIRQVITATGIRRSHLTPFSRCIHCNRLVEPCPVEAIRHRIPEYITQVHASFHRCPECDRVFWPGSHNRRCTQLIDGWFDGL
jgi:uncharacterized protein with PIN domain